MMELNSFFKSVIDQDRSEIVICDLDHDIIYMNPASAAKYAGRTSVGDSIFACHNSDSGVTIKKVIDWFSASAENNIVHTFYNEKENRDVYMVALRDDDGTLIGYYEKHERRNVDKTPMYQMD